MNTLIILILVPVLVMIFLILNPLVSFTPLNKNRSYSDKLSSYECGFTSIIGQTRAPFTIAFYIVGILYLVFDLEIALLIPIVGSLEQLGISSYGAAMIFIIVLTVGFVYELGSGALNWSSSNSTH